MPGKALTITRVIIAILEGAGVVFVALYVWVASSWGTDDSFGARATDMDWWLLAGKRCVAGLSLALVVGALLWAINRMLMYWKLEESTARPLRIALAGASVVATASIAGAIQFAIERPWF